MVWTRIQPVGHIGVWLVRTARRESLRSLALVGRPAPQDDGVVEALDWVARLAESGTLVLVEQDTGGSDATTDSLPGHRATGCHAIRSHSDRHR